MAANNQFISHNQCYVLYLIDIGLRLANCQSYTRYAMIINLNIYVNVVFLFSG